MINNSANDLYIGVTKDPQKRLAHHNTKQGANFTKNKRKFEIVFLEQYETLQQARQREIQIKKWRREKKEMLINRYSKGLNTKM